MKKMYCAVLGLALTLSTFLVSCEQEKNGLEPATSNEVVDIEKVRIEFSKALAQALKEKEVREFLKNEALQKYDGDYDVLYAFVKDKKLTNGKTLEETLTKYANGGDVIKWSAQVPLMTVFIPNLAGFTPETWNIDSQTPDVVVDNNHLKEKTDKLVAFSSDLRQYDVDAKKAPAFPVVVVKENERIIAKSKFDNGSKKTSTIFEEKSKQIINDNNSHSFYFIGDVNPKVVAQSRTSKTLNSAIGILHSFMYHKQDYPNEPGSQRDWIYYRIWPKYNDIELINPNINGGNDYDWSKGKLGDVYYTEKLTKFKFINSAGLEAITDSWTEGNLEFHIIVSFVHRDGSMQNDLKVFFCNSNDLKDNNNNPILYNPNVEINQWDMYRYGDEWKFSFLEHDAGGTTTKTVSSKSTFGYNFEAAAEFKLFVKLGVKFGANGSFEKNQSEVIAISNESDQLGDARVLFDNPVLLNSTTYYSVGTGAIEFSIEPVSKLNDPRPFPYID